MVASVIFLGREAEELPPDAFDDAGKIKAETGLVDAEELYMTRP